MASAAWTADSFLLYFNCETTLDFALGLQGIHLLGQSTKEQGDKQRFLVLSLSVSLNNIQLLNSNPLFTPFFIAPLATLLYALLCCPQVVHTAHCAAATDVYLRCCGIMHEDV